MIKCVVMHIDGRKLNEYDSKRDIGVFFSKNLRKKNNVLTAKNKAN